MTAIRRNLRTLRADKCGATAIEYGLICALIVIAMLGGLTQLSGATVGMWTNISTAVP